MLNQQKAQAEANDNLKKLQRIIPPNLQEQENRLLETFARHKGNVLSKLHDLYGFMEELFSYVSQITPCRKGCSHCCHIPVSVSNLELEYIKKYNRKLKSKVSKASALGTSEPCPFLHHGVCSIYEVRPFVCRKHVAITMTAYWCQLDQCHTTLPQLKFSEVEKTYGHLLSESGELAQWCDIREIHKLLNKQNKVKQSKTGYD